MMLGGIDGLRENGWRRDCGLEKTYMSWACKVKRWQERTIDLINTCGLRAIDILLRKQASIIRLGCNIGPSSDEAFRSSDTGFYPIAQLVMNGSILRAIDERLRRASRNWQAQWCIIEPGWRTCQTRDPPIIGWQRQRCSAFATIASSFGGPPGILLSACDTRPTANLLDVCICIITLFRIALWIL